MFGEETCNSVRLWWVLTMAAVHINPISHKALVLPTMVISRNVISVTAVLRNEEGIKRTTQSERRQNKEGKELVQVLKSIYGGHEWRSLYHRTHPHEMSMVCDKVLTLSYVTLNFHALKFLRCKPLGQQEYSQCVEPLLYAKKCRVFCPWLPKL